MNWNKTPGAFTGLCWACLGRPGLDDLSSKGLCSGKSIYILGDPSPLTLGNPSPLTLGDPSPLTLGTQPLAGTAGRSQMLFGNPQIPYLPADTTHCVQ